MAPASPLLTPSLSTRRLFGALCALQDIVLGHEDRLQYSLLNDFQRDFPLVPQPFQTMAERLHVDEAAVLAELTYLRACGKVSRIGAVFAPRRVGASTLAALSAPASRLDEVAEIVSARPEVNHNYRREHRYNLWFVVTAPNQARLEEVLDEISADTGRKILSLPLVEEFHIDLGFDLGDGPRQRSHPQRPAQDCACPLPPPERRLVAALQEGLELVPRPYARLGMRADMEEGQVLEVLARWLDCGLVKRMGVVVHHHELGYTANAMCVWDVPDELAARYGEALAREPDVTLCYRRRRALPHWRYNLFCMIHGKERGEVERIVADLTRRHGLGRFARDVLFSTHRYKQCGARYAVA